MKYKFTRGFSMIGPMFIAEVSSNHHQDLDRCLAFIDCAAEIGCDAVKFQLFRIDQLFAPEVLGRSEDHRKRREWELPPEWLPHLAAHCKKRDVLFSCTPFDLDAVGLLNPHVAFFKIASYELTWPDLLRACAQTGKPVLLSTGMATLQEVCDAAKMIHEAGCEDLTLLHCSSAYPTPAKQANLAAIETIREAAKTTVGWSDHTRTPAVIHRAVHRWQASCIEFHLDLEGQGDEYASGHCWLPHEMAPVIADIRLALSADGSGKKEPNVVELPDRPWRADPSDGLRPFRELRERLDQVLPNQT
jgi:N-acetylneuraminate synthase